MRLPRMLLALALTLSGASCACAASAEELIVASGEGEFSFLITDVRELTFADEGLTIVTNDNGQVTVPAAWRLRFSGSSNNAITAVVVPDAAESVKVFNTEGMLVQEGLMADTARLPKGVYIVKWNGNSLKIIR